MKTLEQKGYVYKSHISTGGQGEVHLVERDGRLYIAKIFSKLDEGSFLLLKHIQDIKAPNVPRIHDVFNDKDSTILIRDYIEGRTLYEEMEKSGALSMEKAAFITLKLCETLKVFHSIRPHPIVYRDLKPENIMLAKDDGVYLIDFGIARYHKMESNRDTVLAGTRGYTAPEVMAGMQSDNRSDIYSVGLIFYEMLTGKNLLVPPYQIRPVKETNEALPKWADKVIKKSTEMSMVMRYRDISEISVILEKKIRKRKIHRKQIICGAATAAVLALAVLGYGFFTGEVFRAARDTRTPATQENTPSGYEVITDLEFEDMQDFFQMQLAGQKIESGEIGEADYPGLLDGGVYTLKTQTIMGYPLTPGTFVHFRVLPGETDQNGALLFLSFVPEMETMGAFNIPMENRTSMGAEIVNEFGVYGEKAQGEPIMVEHKWIDVIVRMDEDGETLRYLVSDIGNENAIAYGGMRVLEEWRGRPMRIELNVPFEYWEQELRMEAPVSRVEFIRYGEGSLTGYLVDHLPAYRNNAVMIDEFLGSSIPAVPKEQFTPLENQ